MDGELAEVGSMLDLRDKLQSMQRVVLERELDVQKQLDALNARLAQLERDHVPG